MSLGLFPLGDGLLAPPADGDRSQDAPGSSPSGTDKLMAYLRRKVW